MLIFKLREVRSPIMGCARGYRMCLLSTDNKIHAESSDMTDCPSQLQQLEWVLANAQGDTVYFIDPEES